MTPGLTNLTTYNAFSLLRCCVSLFICSEQRAPRGGREDGSALLCDSALSQTQRPARLWKVVLPRRLWKKKKNQNMRLVSSLFARCHAAALT